MPMISASQLADRIGVSRGRISQYVSAGKLDGCFSGSGRQRRFDLAKAAAALGHRLDPGQMMGNGAATKAAVQKLADGGDDVAQQPVAKRDGALRRQDPDRYELARIDKAEQEARRLRRQNAEAEGAYVLASEAGSQTQRLLSRELLQFEDVLRRGARVVADEMGVDFKTVKRLLVDVYREHRSARVAVLQDEAATARLTEEEKAEDI